MSTLYQHYLGGLGPVFPPEVMNFNNPLSYIDFNNYYNSALEIERYCRFGEEKRRLYAGDFCNNIKLVSELPPNKGVLSYEKGKKLFHCIYCGRAFNKSYNCQIHQRIHTGVRPFRCDVCKKRFKRQDHLRDHMFTHNKDKPFKCELCSKGFCQARTLNSHILNQHSDAEKRAIGVVQNSLQIEINEVSNGIGSCHGSRPRGYSVSSEDKSADVEMNVVESKFTETSLTAPYMGVSRVYGVCTSNSVQSLTNYSHVNASGSSGNSLAEILIEQNRSVDSSRKSQSESETLKIYDRFGEIRDGDCQSSQECDLLSRKSEFYSLETCKGKPTIFSEDSSGSADSEDSSGSVDSEDSCGSVDSEDSSGCADSEDSSGSADSEDSSGSADSEDSSGSADSEDSCSADSVQITKRGFTINDILAPDFRVEIIPKKKDTNEPFNKKWISSISNCNYNWAADPLQGPF